jgi:uncharacterized protein YbbC (DUF1343 family)
MGADLLNKIKHNKTTWGRCAFLGNQASLCKDYIPTYQKLKDLLGKQLVLCFSPQHGYWSVEQDNMIESPHTDIENIPLYSLYSETRQPTNKMLQQIDTIIVDLQIVGCRVYTFKATLLECLSVAAKTNKRILILDRPNPIGGLQIEGPILDPSLQSFVGPDSIPMRHGLSVGELANFFNKKINAQLEVVPMENWQPESFWCEYKKDWIYTSPNLPTFNSLILYPGMVIFEGTNISEGRGTCFPFQVIGAPYIKNSDKLIKRIYDYGKSFPGVYIRPIMFKPHFSKWQKEICKGVHICVTDYRKVKSFWLALSILKSFMDFGEDSFSWKKPPYEYEYKTTPVSLIVGRKDFITKIKSAPISHDWCNQGLSNYSKEVRDCLLYKRQMLI